MRFLILATILYAWQGPAPHQGAQNNVEHNSQENQAAPQTSPPVTGRASTDSNKGQTSNEAKHSEEQSVKITSAPEIQTESKKDPWDIALVFATCSLVLIGGAQIVFLWHTVSATRDNAEAARLQAEHIAASERSWMIPKMKTDQNNLILAPFKGRCPVGATCIFENKGKTPAFVLEVGVAIEVIDKGKSLPDIPPPYDPNNVVRWADPGIVIAPEVAFLRFASKEVDNPIDIFSGSKELWAYGYIKYRDIFRIAPKVRETKYCFKLLISKTETGIKSHFLIEGLDQYNGAT
jgi:hypothetical protein